MSAEQKYFKLGLFVLGAGVILVVGIVVLGTASLFEKHFKVETYVDESVQGLDVGAPVKYRGVRIGELEKVDFVAKRYDPKDGRIRLVMNFHPEAQPKGPGENPAETPAQTLERLSAQGMRVRLASAGLTGGVYLELDLMDPKEHAPKELTWTPEYSYMPSVPSTNVRLTTHVETILEHIEKMRLDQISEKIVAVLDSLDKVMKVVDPAVAELKAFAADADGLVKETRRVVTEDVGREVKSLMSSTRDLFDKEVAPAVRSIRTSADRLPGTFDKIDGTLDRIGATLRRVDRTLAEDGGSMDEALDNLRVVTQDLRELTGQVKRYPSQALFGEAPPKKAGNK
ncbi:MAG: MCE family protein [Planctomycetaceae bacterium]|nr:MCE family protein [Planctomycetaceae bacterium]